MKKAVFLDKDGTLIKDVPYNVDPEKVSLLPNILQGLKALQQAGFSLVIVTNQSGLALGYFEEADLIKAMHRLLYLLSVEGVYPVGFYFCPHAVEGTVKEYVFACSCRKPKPGLLLQAAKELGLSLADSWMIGDILNDVEAGRRAGCRTILLDNGNETEWILNKHRKPDSMAANIDDAAIAILEKTGHYGYKSIV